MNTAERGLPIAVLILIAGAIATGAIVAAVLLQSGDRALGEGAGSPAACDKGNAAFTGVKTIPFDAGETVTGVCIKSGDLHTAVLGNGTHLSCYTVSGVGTSTVTVTRTGSPSPSCQEISHIDVTTEPATPTPTGTPAATPPAEATPTATPTAEVLGEVLGETQEPAALPVSGGAPEEAIVSSLYLLLGLAGLALLIGGGTLVAVAVRRRR